MVEAHPAAAGQSTRSPASNHQLSKNVRHFETCMQESVNLTTDSVVDGGSAHARVSDSDEHDGESRAAAGRLSHSLSDSDLRKSVSRNIFTLC